MTREDFMMPGDPIATMPLDPDRPMLEQLEEAAALSQDDRDREWLDKNIHQRPDRLSELISTWRSTCWWRS